MPKREKFGQGKGVDGMDSQSEGSLLVLQWMVTALLAVVIVAGELAWGWWISQLIGNLLNSEARAIWMIPVMSVYTWVALAPAAVMVNGEELLLMYALLGLSAIPIGFVVSRRWVGKHARRQSSTAVGFGETREKDT